MERSSAAAPSARGSAPSPKSDSFTAPSAGVDRGGMQEGRRGRAHAHAGHHSWRSTPHRSQQSQHCIHVRKPTATARTRGEQHVFGLDVAVEDLLAVAVPHRVQQLPKHAARRRLLHRHRGGAWVCAWEAPVWLPQRGGAGRAGAVQGKAQPRSIETQEARPAPPGLLTPSAPSPPQPSAPSWAPAPPRGQRARPR